MLSGRSDRGCRPLLYLGVDLEFRATAQAFLNALGLGGHTIGVDSARHREIRCWGLTRMTTICGDHAKLIESLLALRTSKFEPFCSAKPGYAKFPRFQPQ